MLTVNSPHCCSGWLALLQQEQLYTLEYGITLAQAARKLQVPARQLSNAINLALWSKFFGVIE